MNEDSVNLSLCVSYSSRSIYQGLGYVQWRNFIGVIRRAKNLIANGVEFGKIDRKLIKVNIGSGATRMIEDYILDPSAYELIRDLTAAYKANGFFFKRNETAILALLKKYIENKGLIFSTQVKIHGCLVDGMIGADIAIEFDEPHHFASSNKQMSDEQKDKILMMSGIRVIRVDLDHDIIDLIHSLEMTSQFRQQIEKLAEIVRI